MPRLGLRPHTWKVKGEIPHQQYVAWTKARSQAHFRDELWMLTFDDFQHCWQGYWPQRGRGRDDMCMTREDPEGAWEPSNVIILPRIEHLRRKRQHQKLGLL